MSRNNSIFKTKKGDTVVFPLGIALKLGWVLEGEQSTEKAKSAVQKGNLLAIPAGLLMYLVGTRYVEAIGGISGLIALLVFVIIGYGMIIVFLSGAKKMYNAGIHGEIVR